MSTSLRLRQAGKTRFFAGWLPIVLCAFAASPAPLRAQQEDLQGVYAIDAAASDDIEAAITRGTADMNFAIRPLARSRTAKTNPCYQRIEIHRNENTVSVRYDARPPIDIPADGRSVPWIREDGATYDVSIEWSAAQAVMHFESDTGNRTNTLMLQPDGATLKFNVKLTSSHLPAPIIYTLTYRRAAR
jgi:hypothetical protein